MRLNKQARKRLIAIVCTALILMYAGVLLLPHLHACMDEHCDVCALIKGLRRLLLGLALAAVVCHLVGIVCARCSELGRLTLGRDDTPVGLKVKLSN